MPRLTSPISSPITGPLGGNRAPLSAERPGARSAPKGKLRKAPSPQDRLKARTLFFRRVKRSVKPGLWVLAFLVVLFMVSQAMRAIPHARTGSAAVGHHGFAGAAAALGFKVADIQIKGAQATSQADIKNALGISIGDPIFGVSLTAAESRIEQLGPVRAATIQRELPATLLVTVTERAPYAIWQQGAGASAKFMLIDKAGNVITNQNVAAARKLDPGLLLLAGQDAPQNAAALMADLGTQPVVMQHLAAAERVDGLRWNLILKDQAVVKLPATDELTALAQLAHLQTEMALLDRPVESIDMRLPGRLVVHPYPKPGAPAPLNKPGAPAPVKAPGHK